MFDAQLRRMKDVLLWPCVRVLTAASVSPAAVTAASLCAGVAAAFLAAAGNWTWAVIAWLVNRLLDGLDGPLARQTGAVSDIGGCLDIMADFTVYASLPLAIPAGTSGVFPVGQTPLIAPWIAAGSLLAACYINAASWMYISALMEKSRSLSGGDEHTSVNMPRGIIEGAETILFFTAALVLPQYAVVILGVFAGLTLFTAAHRTVTWSVRERRRLK